MTDSDFEPEEPEGCELCSFTPGGCSFCSGRSAIDVANERTDVAGVPVVDLTEVVQFMTDKAADTPAEETPDP